jgi:acyl transferase domain-containing protein/acyl carrier protein
MLDSGITLFVEIGPHPVVLPSIEQTATASSKPARTLAVARRDEPEPVSWLRAVGTLWCLGYDIIWDALFHGPQHAVRLPLYPWQRERHWLRVTRPAASAGRDAQPRIALSDDQHAWLHVLRWVAPAAARSARVTGQAGGHVLLIAGPNADRHLPYGEAFAKEHATMQAVASVDAAIKILRAGAGNSVSAIVLLASDAESLPYETATLVQSMADGDAPARRPRLTIATCGAQTVDGHERPRVAVQQAALWGLGRVIAEEHPELWGGLVDLDPSSDDDTQAAALAAEVCRRDEAQVAVRDGQRFVLRLRALDIEPATPMSRPWPADGAWLVTGGLGDVGLHLAAGMVAHGVRRLVFVGRSGLPPRARWTATAPESRDGRRIAAVRALEASGAAVHVLVADVADAADLERALRSYEAEAWPPIRGVLHAAGVLEPALVTRADQGSMQRVLTAKLRGAQNLDRLLPQVDRFVMVSSHSATLGTPGMGSYAAANAGLDALAHDRRARGLHGLSIQSGAWIDTGVHSGAAAEQNMRQLNDLGIQGYTPAQGVAVFDALAGRPEGAITVMPIDWSAFAATRRGRDLNLYAGRVSAGSVTASTAAVDGAAFRERLASASAGERRQLMEPVVREAVGRVLKLAPARLDPRKALGSMGLNSLMAMELRNRLETALGRPLSATLAWNYPTVEALVTFLCGDAPASAAPVPTAAAVVPAAVTVDAVAQLSDADAALLLRRKR